MTQQIWHSRYDIADVQLCPIIILSPQAYRNWVATHGEEQPLPAVNLTHNQLFFLNYAQVTIATLSQQSVRTQVTMVTMWQ